MTSNVAAASRGVLAKVSKGYSDWLLVVKERG